jgi:hypothetical protein
MNLTFVTQSNVEPIHAPAAKLPLKIIWGHLGGVLHALHREK